MVTTRNKFLILLIFLLVPTSVSAKVLISEIMYDLSEGSDSGREWIEVFNSYTSSITLTDWKLYENETNHKISEFKGGVSLSSGSYAIIADNPSKFLMDWPNFSGQIFDSAFSLKNDGETLIIRDGELVDIDNVSYTSENGAAGDGNTLHRSSSESASFKALSPTPGLGVLTVTGSTYKEPNTSDSSKEILPTSGNGITTYIAPSPQVYAYIGDDRDVIVGADTLFKARALDKEGNLIDSNVRYIWNFGDGETAEGESVVHVWNHPGRYALVLDVAYNKFAASDRITVTAREAELSVSIVDDGSVAIHNEGLRDLNISSWHLSSSGLYFTIPEKTFLLAGETVRFNKETTGLSVNDETALLYPNGSVAYVAGDEEEITINKIISESVSVVSTVNENVPDIIQTQINSDVIGVRVEPVEKKVENVSDGQVAAAATAEGGKDFLPSSPWIIGLILFVGLGALGAAAARSASRDEYTILEEKD
jgi:hypothetical protein